MKIMYRTARTLEQLLSVYYHDNRGAVSFNSGYRGGKVFGGV